MIWDGSSTNWTWIFGFSTILHIIRRRLGVNEPNWFERPGRDLAPKALQGRIFIDVGIALVDFERLLDEFGVDVLPFSTYFRCDFEQNSDIAFPIIVPSSHKHAKQETQQSHKPQICNLPRLHFATSPLWRTSGAFLVHQTN